MRRVSVPQGRAWYVPYEVCLPFVVAFLASLMLLQAVDIDVSNVSSLSASAADEDDFRRTCFQSPRPKALLAEMAAGDEESERVDAVPLTIVAPSHCCRTALARALLADTAPTPDALA